jgi:hypothetical protein
MTLYFVKTRMTVIRVMQISAYSKKSAIKEAKDRAKNLDGLKNVKVLAIHEDTK